MLNTGIVAKTRALVDRIRYNEINYVPQKLVIPQKLIQSKSQSWVGLERVISDIITFSKIKTDFAIEFGVEFGYSTAVFGNYFKKVTGVDIFTGDSHAGFHGDIYESTKNNLSSFSNIVLVKADYRNYIADNHEFADLIHVDIIHTYEDTYACGLWGAEHSACTLFHDTQSYPEVKQAVADIAKRTGKKFYNYRQSNGLGILI